MVDSSWSIDDFNLKQISESIQPFEIDRKKTALVASFHVQIIFWVKAGTDTIATTALKQLKTSSDVTSNDHIMSDRFTIYIVSTGYTLKKEDIENDLLCYVTYIISVYTLYIVIHQPYHHNTWNKQKISLKKTIGLSKKGS